MTVVARINVSPGQGPLGSASPPAALFVPGREGGGRGPGGRVLRLWGERVDKQYHNQDSPAVTYRSFISESVITLCSSLLLRLLSRFSRLVLTYCV